MLIIKVLDEDYLLVWQFAVSWSGWRSLAVPRRLVPAVAGSAEAGYKPGVHQSAQCPVKSGSAEM